MWTPSKRHKKRKQPQPDTPDWVVEKRRFAKKLANDFSFVPVEGEPLPPWIQYPEVLIGSIGWRMGPGEDFLHEVFFPFWQSLNQSQQTAYFQKFDLGSKWEDRSKWLESLERNSEP